MNRDAWADRPGSGQPSERAIARSARASCSSAGWGCWPRSCQLVMGSCRRAVAGSPRRSSAARSRCIRCSSPYRGRPASSSGCSTGVARGGPSIWTCWRWLASFPWRCCSATMSPRPACGWPPSVSAGCSARMLGATFGTWPMPELRPSISSRRLGLAILMLLLVRIGSRRGGQHRRRRAGELARRLARPARTAPLRGGVLAGPRRAPDLPPGLLRPVRLLRVHPLRGHLPAGAGAARDAAARRCASTC